MIIPAGGERFGTDGSGVGSRHPRARPTWSGGVRTDILGDWAAITLVVAEVTKTHKFDLLKKSSDTLPPSVGRMRGRLV
jgi:hypothetical protein